MRIFADTNVLFDVFAHLSIPALMPEEFFDRMAAEGIVYGEVEL